MFPLILRHARPSPGGECVKVAAGPRTIKGTWNSLDLTRILEPWTEDPMTGRPQTEEIPATLSHWDSEVVFMSPALTDTHAHTGWSGALGH